jgi:hypothetical protein
MSAALKRINELKAQLADHPDLLPGEHARITATGGLVHAATVLAALLALPLTMLLGIASGALIGPALGGVVFAVLGVGGMVVAHRLGTAIALRHLEGAARRIRARESKRLTSAARSSSSVAVPARVEPTGR